jgi:hypothetical protein
MSADHHYVIHIEYKSSPMPSEFSTHSPRRAEAMFYHLKADPDTRSLSCPGLGWSFIGGR